ncbi:MAG: hypothetical protein IIT86_07955, partial [Oscillospiraceae bacterium]|nr:hypothetical protein [Oscillospiraceae bacterium]
MITLAELRLSLLLAFLFLKPIVTSVYISKRRHRKLYYYIEKCSSADLANALNSNTKIIATTIQKFPYIVDSVKGFKNKKFAVIIDEAHSSTSGKDMAAVSKSLGAGEDDFTDVQDMMTDEIRRNGKQPNVSIFAFTATPKPTTLMLFGRLNTKGQREAFHIYSMKQAIEEGFILDVLQNYITYDTYYHLNKEIEEDPRCKTSDAKRQIARCANWEEVYQCIDAFIDQANAAKGPDATKFISYYKRTWEDEE